MELSQIKRIVEAALLASAQPLSLPQLAAVFTETETPTHEELARSLEQLSDECAERGIELKEVASGFRYQVRQDVHPWVARLWTERQTKYSRALLETLALVAYRQPQAHWDLYQLGEELMDLEDTFRVWRFRHVTTVERLIGLKRGTGGTGGVGYLRKMLDVVLFPELWRLRTNL